MNDKNFRERLIPFIRALLLFMGLILAGTMGYMTVDEEYSLIDALYMTIITITTVGFQEVHQLDDSGKIFSIVLILSSVAVYGYIVSTITRFVLEGIFRESIKDYRVNKRIARLKDHVIVCGYGRNGRQAVQDLLDYKEAYVIIDNDEQIIKELREEGIHMYVEGDASDDNTLETARIQHAKALITAMPNDATNTFVILTAKEMNTSIKVISRCSDPKSESRLRKAGANNVIMPDVVGGQRMAHLVSHPNVVEFLDNILLQSAKDVCIREISMAKLKKEFQNQTVEAIREVKASTALIIGYLNIEGVYCYSPASSVPLETITHLFVLGAEAEVLSLESAIIG